MVARAAAGLVMASGGGGAAAIIERWAMFHSTMAAMITMAATVKAATRGSFSSSTPTGARSGSSSTGSSILNRSTAASGFRSRAPA